MDKTAQKKFIKKVINLKKFCNTHVPSIKLNTVHHILIPAQHIQTLYHTIPSFNHLQKEGI